MFNGLSTYSFTLKKLMIQTHRQPRRRNQSVPRDASWRFESLESRQLLSFAAPVSYPIGTTNDGFVPNAAPVNVVTADFNHDGKLDLAVAKTSDNSVYISLGNGDGTFRAPLRFAVGEVIEGGLRVGDFNNDGNPDLFLPSLATGYPAIVMLGNGDGTLRPAINSSSFSVPGTYPRVGARGLQQGRQAGCHCDTARQQQLWWLHFSARQRRWNVQGRHRDDGRAWLLAVGDNRGF